MTCPETIGYKATPVRALVDMAATMVPTPRACLAMVVRPGGDLAGLYAGTPEEAWSAAADLSARIHIVYKERYFHTVLGRAPEMYDELWTAGKVMYKLEPVVSEGGSLTIFAPHVKEVSRTWGRYLERIGYHVRDWFLGRMEQFSDIPRGVLAHSTHVRGIGTWSTAWKSLASTSFWQRESPRKPAGGSTSATGTPLRSGWKTTRAGRRRECSSWITRGRSSTGWHRAARSS